jgi:transposase
VNAIGAYISHGVEAGRLAFPTTVTLPASRAKKPRPLSEQAAAHGLQEEDVGPIDSERFLQFVWQFAGRPNVYSEEWRRERPLMIWMDNYSVHKSEPVRSALPALEQAGISLHYLPSYSPEMSAIEPIWHDVKHHRLRERSHEQVSALKRAVEEELTQKAADLLAAQQKTTHLLCQAA